MMTRLARSTMFALVIITGAAPAGAETTHPSRSDRTAAPDAGADPLLVVVDEAIERTRRRFLTAERHTPWQIIHGLLALRGDFELNRNGRRVNAIDYISNAAMYRGEYWFEATPYGGRAHPFSVPYAFEGHVNQTLALLSMSELPLDHEFRVRGGRTLTMADMVRHARMTVNANEETTWTLWFLTSYLDQDAEWFNREGEPWSMARLVRIQVRSEVTRAPCGGTHQLFALAFARNQSLQQSGQLRGAWLEADQKLGRYIAAAQSLQNSDGSFSTSYFKGRGFSYDFNERIKSSGHMLEWLMMALPDRRLEERWVRRGVESVARDLINNASQPADCGPLYHALHSLVLYRQRVAPPEPMQIVQAPLKPSAPAAPAEPRELPRTVWSDQDIPPPPPSSINSREEAVAAREEAEDSSQAAATDDDLPPLPPRRAVRSAEVETEALRR